MSTPVKQLVKVEKVGPVASIVLNNPNYNELTFEMIAQLDAALTDVKNDPSVKVVVLRSALISAFSAGAKVTEIYKLLDEGNVARIQEVISTANRLANELSNLGKPTVAFIRGMCLGGGNELAMACNWRVATKDSSFGQPEIKLGIIPGMGGTQRLPRILKDSKKAIWMLVTGESLKAKEALELGLIDAMFNSAGDLDGWLKANLDSLQPSHPLTEKNLPEVDGDEQLKKCVEMRMKSFPKACELLLKATYSGEKMSLDNGLTFEQECFAQVLATEDSRKGIEKFLSAIGQLPKKAPAPKPVVEVTVPELKMDTPAAGPAKDSDRSEELKMLKEMVHDFCEERIKPNVNKMESEHRILPEIIQEMAKLGFYGVPFDEKYEGSGLGLRGFAVMMREVSKYHGSTAVMMGAHTSLGLKPIALYGTEAQKMNWLPRGIRGEVIGAYATTEPNVGSDVASISTFAQKVAGGWLVNGAKQFISNGAIADFIIVLAQTEKYEDETDENRKKTMVVLIVPTKSPGFKTTKVTEDKMGLHASCTSAFALDNVFIPDENVIGEVGQGFKIVMNVFNQSRITLGAGCVGALERAQEIMLDFIRSRRISGQMLYEYQATQLAVGKIEITRIMMEALVNQALDAYENDPASIREIAAAVKYICAEDGFWAIDRALQTMGGAGYIADYGMERIYRDFRVNRIFEGTSEVQTLLVAKEWLKRKLMS